MTTFESTSRYVEAAGAGIGWMEPRDINAEKMRFHIRSWSETDRHVTDSEPEFCLRKSDLARWGAKKYPLHWF